jgi:hypothetical protein
VAHAGHHQRPEGQRVHEAEVVVRAEQAACGGGEVEAQLVVRRAAAPVARRGRREEAPVKCMSRLS